MTHGANIGVLRGGLKPRCQFVFTSTRLPVAAACSTQDCADSTKHTPEKSLLAHKPTSRS